MTPARRRGDHGTIPEIARGRASGVLLNLAVEAFGQRHSITRDPVDVIAPIPMTGEFAGQCG